MSRCATTATPSGKVYLIGAGPGDPELLTLRGLRQLMQADVVLYDCLIDQRLLNYAPATARLVDVGKRPGQAHSQAWIQRLMIAAARQGQQVVRLKGGDPFVFGRGGEEAEALARAGIAYEVVPGVSSAIAVPGLAGIPVLHRDHASRCTVVTGHRADLTDMAEWAACLGQQGTLVILMGMAHLGTIARGLQQAGVPADMPVAVIMSGTNREERTVVSTLSGIATAARQLRAPAVIVVGQVVRLRDRLHAPCRDSASRPMTSVSGIDSV